MSTLKDYGTRVAFRAAIADIAKKEVDYTEGYNNNTKYGVWFGLNHMPWCGMFVSWCYDQAARRVGCENPLMGVQTRKGLAGVTESYRVMAGRGWRVLPGEKLLPGDIICWDHDGKQGGPGHTGLIAVAYTAVKFQTVEGNTNTAYSRTGGSVCLHEHAFKDGNHGTLLGIIRPTRKYTNNV